MSSEQATLIRNKIIGVLLRQARLRAGKSVEQCARALDCEPAFISQAETGAQALTLPQIETLAHLLDVPVSHLIDDGHLADTPEAADLPPYDQIRLLRRKIIGVMLRQARLEAELSLQELAAQLDETAAYLERVELGQEQIPFVRLQAWAEVLDISFEQLAQQETMPPLEKQPAENTYLLAHLDPDVRDFVLQPSNIPYLQIAARLSQMPADTLRQVASGLLEITY